MKPVKTIAAVGVAAELLDELKQAIVESAPRLDSQWHWGDDQNPDLLVVDPGEFRARMARTRAQVTGVRYVVVGDAAKHATDRFVLLRPFRKDALAAVLNAAGSATVASNSFADHSDSSFYDIALDPVDPAPPVLDVHIPDTRTPDRAPGSALGLDEMIRGDPLAPAPSPRPPKPLDAELAPPGQETARSNARRDQGLDRMRRAGSARGGHDDPSMPGLSMSSAPSLPMGDEAGLVHYLGQGALGGPARIELDDAPPLVLDPKLEVFHAEADLAALAPYCGASLPRSAMKSMTSTDLAAVRASAPGRPYRDLHWLCTLLAGDGRLGAQLDPGGSFRITAPMEVAADFHAHGAIAAAMQEPRRLHEIAAEASAAMGQVFDVVNAYDAVGLLQWTPRPPRHAPTTDAGSQGGLLSRLTQRLRGR